MNHKCENCNEGETYKDTEFCKDCNEMTFLKNFLFAGAFGMTCLFLLLSIVVLIMSKGN